jgi:hypothetical protein
MDLEWAGCSLAADQGGGGHEVGLWEAGKDAEEEHVRER